MRDSLRSLWELCRWQRPAEALAQGYSAPKSHGRDLRLDFFRGLALIFIFIDHVPGNSLSHLTMQSFGLSDAAEAFVLIAGFAAMMAYAGHFERDGMLAGARRIGRRVRELYAAQILLVAVCAGLLALAARWFENPLYFEHVNLTPFSFDPWGAIWRSLLLYYQLGYINILPLYIVLLAAFPALWWLLQRQPIAALALSVALWLGACFLNLNLPSWPEVYGWYFNPFAWQLVFVLGYMLADARGPMAALRRHKRALRWLGLTGVAVGVVIGVTDYAPDPLAVPEPKLFFMFDKTFATPARILHLLALVALFNGLYNHIEALISPLARFFSMLGRNSLHVFCVGSLVALASQFGRFVMGGSILVDSLVLLVGIICMGITAWVVEWRMRSRAS